MKITRIERSVPRGPNAPARPRSAQEAAIERRLTGYIRLICGHLTTWQEDEFYRMAGSPRDKHWCDKCSKWRKPAPKPVYPDPTEPMF